MIDDKLPKDQFERREIIRLRYHTPLFYLIWGLVICGGSFIGIIICGNIGKKSGDYFGMMFWVGVFLSNLLSTIVFAWREEERFLDAEYKRIWGEE